MNSIPGQDSGEQPRSEGGSQWIIDSDVLAQKLGDEVLLMHSGTNRVYELNATAARLWELLVEGCDGPQIVTRMLHDFDIEPDQLDAEIASSLARFSTEGLLHARQPG